MTLLHITNIKDQAILPLPLSPRSVSEWKGQRRALESNGLKWTFMATLARKVAAYSWTPDIGKCVKDHAWFGKKNGYTLFCSFWLAFQHDLCAWYHWNTLKPWSERKFEMFLRFSKIFKLRNSGGWMTLWCLQTLDLRPHCHPPASSLPSSMTMAMTMAMTMTMAMIMTRSSPVSSSS